VKTTKEEVRIGDRERAALPIPDQSQSQSPFPQQLTTIVGMSRHSRLTRLQLQPFDSPVASRTGMRPRRLRTNIEQPIAIRQYTPSASGDGVDIQLWRLDRHARSGGLEDVLVFAPVAGHVGRGAAHVEADDGGGFNGVV
jgi:hypothetical protein